MMHKWMMEKLALEYITGNLYGFSRNRETYSIVNEQDYNDKLIICGLESEGTPGAENSKILCFTVRRFTLE